MTEPGGKLRSGAALRVGVLGLGRHWRRRYRPALLALRGRFEVTALGDPVAERAFREARRLGCATAAGPAELLERPDVDALLLPDLPWYGLFPLEVACRAGKPVLCGADLARDDAHADRVAGLVRESELPVLTALPAYRAPALAPLQDLLAGPLGPPRLLLATRTAPARPGQGPAALLSWCAALLPGEPRRLLATAPEGGALASLLLDYGDGRAAQLTCHHAPTVRPSWRLQVTAERGTAGAEPGRVHWSTPGGRLTQDLGRPRPAGVVLLERFRQALLEGRAPRPNLADAHRLLRWLRLARRSQSEGAWVPVPAGCANAPTGA